MSYFVDRWDGEAIRELPETQFARVLDELSDADEEHGFVSLTHESSWSLSYSKGRRLILENVETNNPADRFHKIDVPPQRVLELWSLLSRGLIAEVKAAGWLPGYGD